MNTPSIIPAKWRTRRRRRAVESPPGPTALTLVFASFDPGLLILRLSLNKPIDVSGMFPGNLQVNDAISGGGGAQWEGVNGALFNPSTVDVEMSEFAAQAYPDTRLNTVGPTGIVAVEGGEAWAGVSDLVLPFP